MTNRQTIDEFLSLRRLALVGVSRNPHDFSRVLFRELRRRNYDVVPVNPQLSSAEGVPCCAQIREVTPKVDGALLLTPAAASAGVVEECASCGVGHVWLHRSGGPGAVSAKAVELCHQHNIAVVDGECPFMFLPGTGWFHRLHGLWRKRFGTSPR
jgi:predicted CoA-binding protein